MTSDTDPKQAGPGSKILMSLVFLAIGLLAMGLSATWWANYFRSASWESVPATVVSVEFKKSRSKAGSTYDVSCVYRYRYHDHEYTSDRVGLDVGGSSDWDSNRRRYDTLAQHRELGRPFTARVNPGNPQEAFLFRETNWSMFLLPLFGAAFAVAGAWMLLGGSARSSPTE
jgi:hypothetical protein